MPRTFITYAHDTPEHSARVLEFAERLRGEGVDVTLDAYEPHPAEGWQKWMERQLREAEKIVVVVSDKYCRDFDQRFENASGARFEAVILSSILSRNGVSFQNISVAVFSQMVGVSIPLLLEGCGRYQVEVESGYEGIYRWLTNQPAIVPSPLGPVRLLPSRKSTFGQARIASTQPTSFVELCSILRPLVAENSRIFKDFGPNSGRPLTGETGRQVRFDLSLWHRKRGDIGRNNDIISEFIKSNLNLVPGQHRELFSKWLSHIEAFSAHLQNPEVDYREHQFPIAVLKIIDSHNE